MDKTIRVRVFGRDYALRVQEKDEAQTRSMAAFVDEKIESFRKAHPDQPEITAAIISALEITEQLFAAREKLRQRDAWWEAQLAPLAAQLPSTPDAVPSTGENPAEG